MPRPGRVPPGPRCCCQGSAPGSAWTASSRPPESPGQFVEIFVVPSWDEYLRQQGRRTVADAALDDRLRAFLQSGTEPDMAHFLTPPKPHHHDPDQK
jgi:hypothetical protein